MIFDLFKRKQKETDSQPIEATEENAEKCPDTAASAEAPVEEVPEQPAKKRGLTKERFNVAGVYYHMDAVKALATSNPDWRKSGKTLASEGKIMVKIPRYTYADKPVKLIPEPTNEYDTHAIKVLIAGEHVGYINSEDSAHVGDILAYRQVKYLYAQFSEGEYKVVSENGDAVKMDNHVSIKLFIGYL